MKKTKWEKKQERARRIMEILRRRWKFEEKSAGRWEYEFYWDAKEKLGLINTPKIRKAELDVWPNTLAWRIRENDADWAKPARKCGTSEELIEKIERVLEGEVDMNEVVKIWGVG